MIDSQPGDFAFGDEPQDLLVRGVEDTRIFHPDGAEVVDVEKAPIVDLIEGGFPVRDAIRLTIEQVVQAIEAAGLSGLTVETRDNTLDGGADVGRLRDESGQPFADGSRDVLPTLLVFQTVPRDGRQPLERLENSLVRATHGLPGGLVQHLQFSSDPDGGRP